MTATKLGMICMMRLKPLTEQGKMYRPHPADEELGWVLTRRDVSKSKPTG